MTNRLAAFLFLAALALLPVGCGASTMSARISNATQVLAEINTLEKKPTAQQIKDAKGVVIMNLAQGGIGIGGEGGGGVALKRVGGGWGAPYGIDAAAGTIGAQLGGQGKDVLIVFNDETSLQQFVKGGMQLQAVAEGTGGNASGNTRSTKLAYEYFIKGSGLYGGAELGGLNFSPANKVNAETYGSMATSGEILDGKVKKPDGLSSLTSTLDAMAR